MMPKNVRKEMTLHIIDGVCAEFYTVGDNGFFCDVFFGPSITGEGFAPTKATAFKEALHNAANRICELHFPPSSDNSRTIPTPPPSQEQEP